MLTIDPEFKDLIPPPTEEEYCLLTASIVAEGCREPLLEWNGILIDGHTRYRICQTYDVPLKTNSLYFDDRFEAMKWIINNQFGRRNLTLYVRGELKLKLKEIIAEQAKERSLGNLKYIERQNSDALSGRTDDILADQAGMSRDTLRKMETLSKEADNTTIEKLRKGHESIHSAWVGLQNEKKRIERDLKVAAIQTNNLKAPDSPFDVVVFDPPWPYGTQYDPKGRRAANPYPEMSLKEIADIELPAKQDAILWFWTTHKFMRHTFEMLDKWLFREVAILTWVKDRIGLGSWLRSQSEFCIMAVRGKPLIQLSNQSTVLFAKTREHSRKPDEFYEMVDKLCVGSKLDYFSREPRQGWAQFGAECSKFSG